MEKKLGHSPSKLCFSNNNYHEAPTASIDAYHLKLLLNCDQIMHYIMNPILKSLRLRKSSPLSVM